MLTLNCPSCGANIEFRSKDSVFTVCSFCKSTLVRQDIKLEDIGKMASLQDDMSPFQIGTKGTYKGKSFELIGRLKVGYPGGFWNEWYALFGADSVGWLAEAQGFLAMCFPFEGAKIPPVGNIKNGLEITFGEKGEFVVNDIQSADCLYSEGELPMNARLGRKSTSVDLLGEDCEMATIEYADATTRVYVGGYQEYDDFHFSNVRRFDGW
jgi:hypothetical protein